MIETGTISAGTMQPRDLIPAFMDALVDNGAGDIEKRLVREYQKSYDWPIETLERVGSGMWSHESRPHRHSLRCDDETLDRIQEKHPDAASELIHDLFDALDDIAPPFHYFGAIDGDGADYGFWVQEDQIRESIERATRLGSSEYLVSIEDEIFWHVNDHGNVTGWPLAELLDTTPMVEIV